jgi:glycosyltransferase involved in cell wall biosynthesis
MKTLSIVTGCYNEAENVPELIRRVRAVMAELPAYTYEHIFIDNCSTDATVAVLKTFAAEDRGIKIIVNARNFGHIRSPYHALLQAHGDAVISLVADLQDPPEMILEFVRHWEAGHKVVVGIKTLSRERWWIYRLRGLYYKLVKRLSDVDLLEHFTGFGLYDRQIMDVLRGLREPYPYFRGLISDIGFNIRRVEYTQPERLYGQTKNNFLTLFDMAMLGFTNYSKVPLRLATLLGFSTAVLSLLVGMSYLVAKLIFWQTFSAGMAPVMIGIFFLGSVQLFFMGIVGEYVGAVFTYVQNRPLVVEKERINFGPEPSTRTETTAHGLLTTDHRPLTADL